MTRTKGGFISKKRHKKIIDFNKGYYGSQSRLFKIANQENMRSLKYSYNDRRKRKNNFRKIWIKQINNTCKTSSLKYNQIIRLLKLLKIEINRKILSKLIQFDTNIFNNLMISN